MRTRLLEFLAALAVAALACVVPCQEPAGADAPTAVERALEQWQRARQGKPAARVSALRRLGGYDDPRVTAALLEELERAGDGTAALEVLRALGARPRGVVRELADYLLQGGLQRNVQIVAAQAVAQQGAQGIDTLIAIAEDDATDAGLREACFDGLARVDDDRAWRGLASFALRGDTRTRQGVMRRLAAVRGVRDVTRVRLELVEDADAVLAATAWRQLAAEGHDRAAWLFEDLIERVSRRPPPPVRAELVAGLPYILDEDYYGILLELAADGSRDVRQELRAAAPELAKDAEFVTWLVRNALDSGQQLERDVAMTVLRVAPAESLAELLERVRRDLRRPTERTLDVVIGLHELLAKDPKWTEDLMRLAESRDAAVRTVGLALLLEAGCPDAVAIAQDDLDHKSWELRSVCFRYLTRFRELSSIPLLIDRVGREHGRLDGELGQALFVLTGVRCWTKREWQRWWREHKDGHRLPAQESVRAMASAGGGGATVAYYGIPLSSKRVTFLIDVSGSMNAKVGTDRKRTRLDEAKRQLRLVVDKLDEDYEFNIIVYETGVEPTWERMQPARTKTKQEAFEAIAKLQPRGGTNIHDAIEEAFRDPEVDTIYLLTDGQPSAGRITDVQDLADAVRRWNYERQIVIHGIAVGTKSALLERLAKESGGEYVVTR